MQQEATPPAAPAIGALPEARPTDVTDQHTDLQLPICIASVKATFGIDEPAAVRDALALFPQPALQHVHEIIESIKLADAVTVQVVLHKFKSSSRFIGAYALGDLLETMQRLAEQRRLGELAGMREQLLYEVRRVFSFIEQYARH